MSEKKSGVKFYPPQLIFGSAQSAGMVRNHNEDTLFAMNTILADDVTQQPFGLFVIADGMGGHQDGEEASKTAVRAAVQYLTVKLIPGLVGLQDIPQDETLLDIMTNSMSEAQLAVLRRVPGGGTTLTIAILIGRQVLLAHVGDSRLYLIEPDGRLVAISEDHSVVRRMVDLEQISVEEAATHPQRNLLYRAVGQPENFTPDVASLILPDDCRLLMCSDGLWGALSDKEISRIIQSTPDPSCACYNLVEAANEAGGPDNISVIIAAYK